MNDRRSVAITINANPIKSRAVLDASVKNPKKEYPSLVRKVASNFAEQSYYKVDYIHKAFNWIAANFSYQNTILDDGQQLSNVIATRRGNCVGLSKLFEALLEYVGIKTRGVHGALYIPNGEEGKLVLHRFSEVFIEDIGWIFYDIQSQRGFVDANHLVFFIESTQLEKEYIIDQGSKLTGKRLLFKDNLELIQRLKGMDPLIISLAVNL